MRLLLIVLCAFLMQVNSSETEPLHSTDAADVNETTTIQSETTTRIESTTAANDEVKTTGKLTEQTTENSEQPIKTPSVLLNTLLERQDAVATTTKKSKRSYESAPLSSYASNAARFTRDSPMQVQQPLTFVKPFGYNGKTSACSCYCPPLAPLPRVHEAPYPLIHYPSAENTNIVPNTHHKFRTADDDADEIEDSMPNEAQSRSAYAENPSYPNAYPSQSYAPQPAYVEPKKPVYASQQHYAAPAPTHTYSYPSPAPQVSCGQNLLAGCAPTIAEAPCSSAYYSY